MIPVLVKAALPKIRPSSELPDLSLVRHDVPLDAKHVASYAALCGFPRKDVLPLPYPHLLACGLHLEIMADGSFPFPAIGTVHLENSITQHRPIALTEQLQVTARPADLRPHAKGQVFDMLTTVHSAGELVWEETSTFLRRGAGSDDAPRGAAYPEAPPTGTVWKLPGDLGRSYAGISGDRNPIHLYGLTAKAFGFPRQIAHGMWSMARCVGALENRLPDRVRVDVAFKKPILLPGSVAFGSRPTDDGYAFSLSNPKSGAPHLAGRTVST
ncbi:MaoC/PaaZ C-terminal domain-containing protein [Nocardioides hankookensis]|uniref:MaoC/PaaZ C-terminal domain-containing protein n=1 Tax=Nocardioides hankookensis TaxID=443157 RepID=A0ABW1LK83_9ACTN